MLSNTFTINSLAFVKDSDNTAAGTIFTAGTGFGSTYLTIRQAKPAPGKPGTVRSLASLSIPIPDVNLEYAASSPRATINFTVTYPFGVDDASIVTAVKTMIAFLTGNASMVLGTEAAAFVDGQS